MRSAPSLACKRIRPLSTGFVRMRCRYLSNIGRTEGKRNSLRFLPRPSSIRYPSDCAIAGLITSSTPSRSWMHIRPRLFSTNSRYNFNCCVDSCISALFQLDAVFEMIDRNYTYLSMQMEGNSPIVGSQDQLICTEYGLGWCASACVSKSQARVLVQTQDRQRNHQASLSGANEAQAANAAFHRSVIVAWHPPSLPVLNCPFGQRKPSHLRYRVQRRNYWAATLRAPGHITADQNTSWHTTLSTPNGAIISHLPELGQNHAVAPEPSIRLSTLSAKMRKHSIAASW